MSRPTITVRPDRATPNAYQPLPADWSPAPCVLGVPHHGRDRMVGMLFAVGPLDTIVFFHAHEANQAVDQGGFVAPVDACVIDLLLTHGIGDCYDLTFDPLPAADPTARRRPRIGTLRRCGARDYAERGAAIAFDGRDRLGLNDAAYVALQVAQEYSTGRDGQRRRVYRDASGEVAFIAPWVANPCYALTPQRRF